MSKSTQFPKAYILHIDYNKPLREKSLGDSFESFSSQEKRSSEECLNEVLGLARAIDLDIVGSGVFPLKQPSPATYLRSGNVLNLKGILAGFDIEVVIVNASITPVQQRNLEKAWQCKVIDRTALILEIFGARARTSEGCLQVELATLKYQRSRLVRSWTHLERQRGGFGTTGGPGESQLELDRRMIDDRVIKIERALEQAVRTRHLHRSTRRRVPYPIVALVGYTNAGKSTLFNKITKASVIAVDQLFATLDPTMRHVKLPSGLEIILSDTVGFISDLPTQLIAAFRATLEEVVEADLIIHVRDSSHLEAEFQDQDVYQVLKELNLEHKIFSSAWIEVHNKADLLTDEEKESLNDRLGRPQTQAMILSALKGEGVPELLRLIDQCIQKGLTENNISLKTKIPSTEGSLLAWLYRRGAIVSRHDEEDLIYLTLRLSPQDFSKLKTEFGELGVPYETEEESEDS